MCQDDRALDATLTELEDRGLVGWDKLANRYDLHPIVRGVVWSGLGDEAKRGVYSSLHAHFEALPMIDDYLKVSRLEDLTPAIELYNALIGLGRYDDAERLFDGLLDEATLWRLSASRQRVELLEMLFPDGLGHLPRVRDPAQAATLNALALGYLCSGQPGRSVALHRRANTMASDMKYDKNLSIGLRNLSEALRSSGALCEAQTAARCALNLARENGDPSGESLGLNSLGYMLAMCGRNQASGIALERSLALAINNSVYRPYDFQAIRSLWMSDFERVRDWADKASDYSQSRFERGEIRSWRLQGAAALGMHDLATADERLHHALIRARQVNYVEEELPALIALAELRRQEGKPDEAREFLDDVWDAAERGPYPLFHADACNVLAQLERDAGNLEQAIAAATKAYRLAWCDGPPFAYHWGLVAAQKHLRELGAPEPGMPPFDESKFEPMPEVEIDPDDEFHEGMPPEPNAAKLAALREATNDPLFQTDLQEVAEDFKNVDAEGDEE